MPSIAKCPPQTGPDQPYTLAASPDQPRETVLTSRNATAAWSRALNAAPGATYLRRRSSGEEAKDWTLSEDLTVDLGDLSSVEALDSDLLQIDFCRDVKITGSTARTFRNWSDASEEKEFDLSSSFCPPDDLTPGLVRLGWSDASEEKEFDLSSSFCPLDDLIPGLVRFGAFGWKNSTNELDLDQLCTDTESDDLQTAWKPLRLFRETRSTRLPGFLTSGLVHFVVFVLFFIHPVSLISGSPHHSGNVITARIVADEDWVPQDESPASVDSAASTPSTKQKTKQDEKPNSFPVTDRQTLAEKPPEENKTEKEEPVKEDSPKDSTASLPSTASAERRFIASAGLEGKTFEHLVLSAIREAIFYPKKAVNERHYGEVVVAFALGKDGSLLNLSITKPSGSAFLDDAALKIIRKAAGKFPPIPDAFKGQSVDYVVPILFKEKRG